VPNCELVENYVTNWSSNDRKIRHIIPVSVPSGSDSSRVSEVLLNATRQHPDVLLDPPAEVRLKAFHERGLDFELLVWSVATNHAAFRSEITLRAYQAFRSYGVIPTV